MGKKSTPRKFGVISASNISMSIGFAPSGFLTARVSSACGTSSQASWIARATDKQLSGRDTRLQNLVLGSGERRPTREVARRSFPGWCIG